MAGQKKEIVPLRKCLHCGMELTYKNFYKLHNSSDLDMVSAYMKIVNLKQSKGKTYDNTIIEENLSQEMIRCSVVDKVVERFGDEGLYQDIYNLCLKLLQSLKKSEFRIDYFENVAYSKI